MTHATTAPHIANWTASLVESIRIGGRIAAYVARRRLLSEQREALAQLHALPAYMLDDIGLKASDLPAPRRRLMDFHPHLVATGQGQSHPLLPANLSSR